MAVPGYCGGISHALCKIEMGGLKAAAAYYFDPACGHRLPLRLLINDDEDAWELDPEIDAPELATIKDDPTTRPIKAMMSFTSIAPGDVTVVVSYADGGEEMLATYKNRTVWQPHRSCPMKLVDVNHAATGIRWRQRLGLEPGVDLRQYGWPTFSVTCTGCRSVTGATVAIFGLLTIEDHLPTGDDCIGGGYDEFQREAICALIEGSWFFPHQWNSTDDLPFLGDNNISDCGGSLPGGDDLITCWGREDLIIQEGYGLLDYYTCIGWYVRNTVPTGTIEISAGDNRNNWRLEVPGVTDCEFWLSAQEYDLEWNDLGLPCDICNNADTKVKFTPYAINLETWTPQPPPEPLPSCTPINVCRGEAQYYVRRNCYDGTQASYECELYTHTCRGNCEDDGCRPQPPFAPTGLISDEDAEDLGLIALVDTLVAGVCGCIAPIPPADCNTGCSLWEVAREACPEAGPSYSRWYWAPMDSTCGTKDCEETSCGPKPPDEPVLPFGPIPDADADDLLAIEGDVYAGTCECDYVYVPSECGECTCELAETFKTFTISGAGEPNDGTYTIEKGAGSLGDCNWFGGNEGAAQVAELYWTEPNSWTLEIGGFTYTAVGGLCDNPIVLTGPGGSGMPTTVTVSNV